MNKQIPDGHVIRLYPIAGWCLAVFGGIIAVLGLMGLVGLTAVKIEPAIVAVEILGGGLFAFVGIHFIRNPGDRLRFTNQHLGLMKSGKAVPWEHIEDAELVQTGRDKPGSEHSVLVLAIELTAEGRKQLSGPVHESGLSQFMRSHEDIAFRVGFWSVGEAVGGLEGLVEELRRRAAAARGEASPAPKPGLDFDESLIPDAADRPTRREGSRNSRVYIHRCGNATIVTDGSFRGLCNPYSYTSGTMCMECGVAMLEDVRWEETGETVAAFRSRMRRHTPIGVKVFNFLIIPALFAAGCYFLFPFANKFGDQEKLWGSIGLGVIVGYLAVFLTPLPLLASTVIGLRYTDYK